MTLLSVLLLSCLCTLGGASFRAVDVWDRFYSAQKPKSALRGASVGKVEAFMPSLPAVVHNVDSADVAPSVVADTFGSRANKKAHPSLQTGWVSKDSSSVVIPKH